MAICDEHRTEVHKFDTFLQGLADKEGAEIALQLFDGGAVVLLMVRNPCALRVEWGGFCHC